MTDEQIKALRKLISGRPASRALTVPINEVALEELIAEVERLRAENTVQRVVNMRAQSRISYLASLAGEGDE